MNQRFKYSIVVGKEHIDVLKHVNNEVYLKWLIEAADAHSTCCGYSVEKYLGNGSCFVVRRHEIDYLAPAFLGEKLIVETWIKEMYSRKSCRAYQIKREHDGKTLLMAETLWVYVNLRTGRPVDIPPEIVEAFDKYHGQDKLL